MKSANTRFRGKTGLALFLLLALLLPTLISCRGNNAESSKSGIAILYTADIHSYIDGPLSYDVIAALKQSLAEEYARVLLVDAGDHLQGTAYGSMDEGRTVTELMNAAGYDAATLGNHEFDYGMFGCMRTIDNADFSYVSCNFYHETNGVRGENVLDPYVLFECGDEVISYSFVERFIMELPERYGVEIVQIGYDRYNAISTVQKLEANAFSCVEIRQHSSLLHRPTKLLKEAILSGFFRYDENLMLEINFENARCTEDTNLNKYVNKKKSSGKVDLVVAAINALCLLQLDMESGGWGAQII